MALPIRYLDGHVHIFPDVWQQRIYRWFEEGGWAIKYRHLSEEAIWQEVKSHGAEGASVLIYAHRPGIARELNRWLYGWAQERPELHLYGTVHPDDPDGPEIVKEALETFHFAGFKIHANVQRVRVDDERLEPLYRAVLDNDRSLIIHAGREPHRNDFVGVHFFRRLMVKYPSLRVQVAHLGYDELDAFVDLLGSYPFMYLDTAAIPGTRLHCSADQLHTVIEQYPDRIIYGSDAPILEESLVRHRDRIWRASGTSARRTQVFRTNLERFWAGGR